MQDDPSLTRAGKKFRGKVEDTEQSQVRYRAYTPQRLSEGFRETPALLLDNSTQTTSPPEHNTLAGSSQGGPVRTLQIPGGGQENPHSAQPQQTNSPNTQPQQTNSSSA